MDTAGGDFDPRRVLVVDDEGPMLRTHGRVLDAHGFSPVLMADAGEALVETRRCLPAALLVDLVMPGMSGLELATRIRAEQGGAAPPLLLVSPRMTQLTAAEACIFDALHSKPYSVGHLIADLERLISAYEERRRASSEVWFRRGALVLSEPEDG